MNLRHFTARIEAICSCLESESRKSLIHELWAENFPGHAPGDNQRKESSMSENDEPVFSSTDPSTKKKCPMLWVIIAWMVGIGAVLWLVGALIR